MADNRHSATGTLPDSSPAAGSGSAAGTIELAAKTGPWCRTCGSRHVLDTCSRDYSASGTERHGWRALIEGKEFPEVYGVLIAPLGLQWRARILTYPNVVWMVPGGGASMKFLASSAAQAEADAVVFIQGFCNGRGLKISRRLPNLEPGPVDHEESEATRADAQAQANRRRLKHIPLWWGKDSADEEGLSEDLSECGLFLISGKLQPKGTKLLLRIKVEDKLLDLSGTVTWVRDMASGGRRVGMGIDLDSPPLTYKEYVRSLP